MDNDSLQLNYLYLDKKYIRKRKIRIFENVIYALSIICFLLIIILMKNINGNYNYEKYHKISEDLRKKNILIQEKLIQLKKNYSNDIYFYKHMLQLYIENRTEFYIKGRQRVMERIGSHYNDSNIITVQDKYNWLIIHDSPEKKSKYVDKILLHEYSKEVIGKDICVPIIKIYNNIDEINLNELPNKFVLKCNHGSGMNIFCKNKKNFDIVKAKKLLKHWMTINWGINNFEYQYLNVQKKVFSEEYLCDDILDYKFYCFNGEPKFIRVQKHLKGKSIHNYYDLNFTLNEIETNMPIYIRRSDIKFPKPKHLKLMIKYARKLSKKFAFVRVDLYEANNKVYLGELTFTSINVYMPYKDRNQSIYLSSFLDITKINKSLNNS